MLLTGVAGLSISMLCFGLSRTFIGLVIRQVSLQYFVLLTSMISLSRCLVGMLNGNIGVIKCMMAGELMTKLFLCHPD